MAGLSLPLLGQQAKAGALGVSTAAVSEWRRCVRDGGPEVLRMANYCKVKRISCVALTWALTTGACDLVPRNQMCTRHTPNDLKLNRPAPSKLSCRYVRSIDCTEYWPTE